MQYISDYHIHSIRSFDGTASLNDICEEAVSKGISEIAVTDHCDLNCLDIWPYSPEAFYGDTVNARKVFGDKIKIKFGIEIGQQTEFPELSKNMLDFEFYDFVIGSYHCMKGYKDFYELDFHSVNVKDTLALYFNSLIDYCKSADLDVLGHITYPIRYAKKHGYGIDIDSFLDETEAALRVLIERGKGIEVNTSGYRSGLGDTMPPSYVLKLYKDIGGQIITVGSDAHKTEDLGYRIKETYEYLKSVGFKYYTTFEKRKPKMIKL